jgi:hypothetical protein
MVALPGRRWRHCGMAGAAVTTFTDELREALYAELGSMPVGNVATQMHISRTTLYRFLHGQPISSRQLDAIDNWVRVSQLRRSPALRAVHG